MAERVAPHERIDRGSPHRLVAEEQEEQHEGRGEPRVPYPVHAPSRPTPDHADHEGQTHEHGADLGRRRGHEIPPRRLLPEEHDAADRGRRRCRGRRSTRSARVRRSSRTVSPMSLVGGRGHECQERHHRDARRGSGRRAPACRPNRAVPVRPARPSPPALEGPAQDPSVLGFVRGRSRFLQEGSEAEEPGNDVDECEGGEQTDPGPSLAGPPVEPRLERSGGGEQYRCEDWQEQQRQQRLPDPDTGGQDAVERTGRGDRPRSRPGRSRQQRPPAGRGVVEDGHADEQQRLEHDHLQRRPRPPCRGRRRPGRAPRAAGCR